MTMKNIIFTFNIIILFGLFTENVAGQITFVPVETKLQLQEGNNELTCLCSSMTVKFPLKREVKVLTQANFVKTDNQTIQIISLKYDGYNKDTKEENLNNQKELLDIYSKYELEYFKNELGVEVVNHNSQWVVTKSKGWFIWYFKVGKVPTQADIQTEIQLFATTIIRNKILIINAPILTGGDFSKAALIVNDMMESMIISKP
jgi:hypothetical protein